MAVRVVHFADAHLGFYTAGRPCPDSGLNSRVHDVLDRLDEVASFVEDEGVHVVCFAGDAFSVPRPGPTLEALFAERITRMAATGAHVVLLAGCTDQPRGPGQRGPLAIYRALSVPRVTVADAPRLLRLHTDGGEIAIACLPWSPGTNPGETVAHLVAAADGRGPVILLAHIEPRDVAAVGHPRLAVAALGHVHTASGHATRGQPFVAYAGSLERFDFDFGGGDNGHHDTEDDGDKGFWVYDINDAGLDRDPEFVPVAARRLVAVTVTLPDDAGQREVAQALAAIATPAPDALVRVRVEGPRAALAFVDTAHTVESMSGAADVRVDLHARRPARVGPVVPDVGVSGPAVALDAWLAQHPEMPDRERVRARGHELIDPLRGKGG